VKPRVFIGSSTAAAIYAGAIHDVLADSAECTPWTEGAFGLSKSTIDNLMKNLRDSDFGIFVFAADDTASIKGEFLNVPRDNVVYEAGMFAGYLSPERCFIAVPKSVPVRIPTDLLGMTLGFYEDDRSDKNYVSAVSTFCRQAMMQISRQGLFTGQPREMLRELCMKFQCCDWITDGSAT
jgi:predicted nucleotide-binding protein